MVEVAEVAQHAQGSPSPVPPVLPVPPVPPVPAEPAGLRARQQQLLAEHHLLDSVGAVGAVGAAGAAGAAEDAEDAELGAVVRLAAAVTGYPSAVVNVLGAELTCRLAGVGAPPVDMLREDSLCHRASLVGGLVTSQDTSTDPRFADLPWVDGRLGSVRRYAMAPLAADGTTIGSLCVFDGEPGPALGEAARGRLLDLAQVAASLLQRRRDSHLAEAARAETALAHGDVQRAQAFDRALLEALPVGVVAADAEAQLTLLNDVGRRWLGAGADAGLSPEALAQTYHLFEADGTTPLAPHRVPLLRVYAEGTVTGAELVISAADAPPRTVECTGVQVRDAAGRVLGAVVAMADVTAQRALEAELRRAAAHDALTGLPNRATLTDRLAAALAEPAGEGEAVAVLYCDLDGFKAVNDAHGHAAGDAVLVEVAARLAAAVRGEDAVTRVGGDEFVLVCPGVRGAEDAERLAARVGAVTAEPVLAGGVEHRVGISVGVVLSGPRDDAETLLRAADAAMYTAKRARRQHRAREER